MDVLIVSEKVKQIISNACGTDAENIQLSDSLIDDLDFGSLDLVQCVMEAEDQFGIEIPDEDGYALRTVQDAVTYIQKRLQP